MRIALPTRLLFVLLAILLSLPLFTPEVRAQAQPSILLTARAGFDGYAKTDRWIPVQVTLENTGANAQVVVQVSYVNRSNGETTYQLDLALPAGARKEFFLYTFPEFDPQKLTVSVIENKKTLVKRDVAIAYIKQGDLLVGLLSDSPSNYSSLGSLSPLAGTARIVRLSSKDLPGEESGWQALDALVVADADSGALSAEQRSALGLWLAEGGKLLVVGGANWQPAAAGLIEFLPLRPTSAQKVGDLSALQTYFRTRPLPSGGTTLATGTLHKDAQILVEQDGLPLLTRRPLGFGEIYYFAADPAVQPLKGWDGISFFYSHLLGARITLPRWATQPWDVSSTESALAAQSELSMPPFLLICCWLGLYLALIGPLNYILLRRLKRPELAWLTIPALVIGFTFIAYLAGFLYRGTRPTLSHLLVAQGWDSAPQMRADAVLGLYSPNRTRFDIEAEAPFKFLPRKDDANWKANGDWLALEQDERQQVSDTRFEIGALKSISLQGSLPALAIAHNLTVTISNQTPLLTGEITNNGSLVLKDAFLVTPGAVIELQDLKPGESRPVNTSLKVDRYDPGFYTQASPKFLRYYDIKQENLTSIRRSLLLSAAAAPQSYDTVPSNWGIYLMGWVEAPLLPAGPKNVLVKTEDTSLIIQMLAPAFQFKGNTWQLNSAVFAWETSMFEASPYSSSVYQLNQSYALRFRPAVPLHYSKVAALTITFETSFTTIDEALQLWDYTDGTWVTVEMPNSSWGKLEIPIPKPERFVGPGGELILSLKNPNPNDWGQVYESSINLVVEP